MWRPDLLHMALAGALILGVLHHLWSVRGAGRRGSGRTEDQTRVQALERKVDALRRIKARYKNFFEQAPVGIFRTLPSGGFVSANGNLAKMLGYASPGELMEQVTDIAGQLYVSSGQRAEMYRKVLAEGVVKNLETNLRRRDGELIWLSLSLRVVRDEAGGIGRLEGFAVDVTGRKRAEEALAASERMFRQMLRWMRDILYRLDPEGRIVFISHAVTRYGHRVEGLLGRDIRELARPGDRDRLRRRLAERRTGERRTSGVEFLLLPGPGFTGPDASPPVMLLEAEGIYETDADGDLRFLGSIGMARDITRRKLAEERLTQSLEAKELLLRELQHRVKNNLQVLLSLISLTASRAPTPEAALVCREIQGYVRCMSAMHALLSRARAGDRVGLADMVRDIYTAASGLFATEGVAPHFDLEDIPLHMDKALPFGMLLNELLTNTFKHAFPDGRPGRVSVGLYRLDDGRARLTVADDGVGYDDGVVECGLGVGMGLIHGLAGQLDGELSLDGEIGSRAHLVFHPDGWQDRLQGALPPNGGPDPRAGASIPADEDQEPLARVRSGQDG
ncbi:MAG: PAS domain S-box protein [Thermodesulfobacteriota bacterium]